MQLKQPAARGSTGKAQRGFVLFGFGQFSRSIVWSVTDLLVAYHLVERLGFSGGAAGAILVTTILLSAFPDIFVAGWIARRPDPTSSSLKLQGIYGVASLASALMLFGPAPVDHAAKLVYVCVISAAFRLSYAIYDVSQNALISLLPQTRAAVPRYVTNKIFATSMGRLAASFLVLLALNRPADHLADLKAMSFAVVPVLVSAVGLFRLRTRPSWPASHAYSTEAFRWRSLPWASLAAPLFATAFMVGLLQVVQRLLPFLGAGSANRSTVVVAFVCGTVVGPLLAWSGNRAAAWLPATSLLCVLSTISAVALLYQHGTGALIGSAFIYGIATSALTTLIWERVAMLVTDHAATTGTRIDAPAFALLTTCIKLSLAVSSGLLGVFVDAVRNGVPGAAAPIAWTLSLGGFGVWVALVVGGMSTRLFIGRAGRVVSVFRGHGPRPADRHAGHTAET